MAVATTRPVGSAPYRDCRQHLILSGSVTQSVWFVAAYVILTRRAAVAVISPLWGSRRTAYVIGGVAEARRCGWCVIGYDCCSAVVWMLKDIDDICGHVRRWRWRWFGVAVAIPPRLSFESNFFGQSDLVAYSF